MKITQKEFDKLRNLGYDPVKYDVYTIEVSESHFRNLTNLTVERLIRIIMGSSNPDCINYAVVLLETAMFEFLNVSPELKQHNIHQQKGLRYNEGKLRWSLIPHGVIEELIKVLEFGAKKYAPGNWQLFTKAQTDENCYDSMMRHIQKWRGGETHDSETGLHHMAHVLCNAMFILWHSLNGTK